MYFNFFSRSNLCLIVSETILLFSLSALTENCYLFFRDYVMCVSIVSCLKSRHSHEFNQVYWKKTDTWKFDSCFLVRFQGGNEWKWCVLKINSYGKRAIGRRNGSVKMSKNVPHSGDQSTAVPKMLGLPLYKHFIGNHNVVVSWIWLRIFGNAVWRSHQSLWFKRKRNVDCPSVVIECNAAAHWYL